ncbi:PP2C family serine/threonine-protein phosphatase [Caulobacter sp. KR2-114]|uniref:PP2C family serine/threonine-protein phosphatase n=1 Tax=Caulobacter sp. KR2-114 TaxID=3400912 RepID=UPI003C128276
MSGPDARVIAASVRGAGHVRRGQPNQDFAAAERLDDGAWAIVVSDGHGAELHARSETGSRLAVEAALAELRRIDWRAAAGGGAAAAPALIDAIVELWRDKVEADIDERPLEPETLAASEAAGLGQYGPYGATLVAAAVRGEEMLLLQIGDGDLYVRGRDGRVERPLPDDPRPGEETASLCMPSPQAEARWRIAPRPAQVLASTDGFSKSFPEPQEAVEAAGALLDRALAGVEPATLQGDLSALSARGSSDDISIAAWLEQAAGAAAPASVQRTDPPTPTPSRWGLWAALAAAVAGAALAWRAGWLAPPPKPPPVNPPVGLPSGPGTSAPAPPDVRGAPSDRRPGARHGGAPGEKGSGAKGSGVKGSGVGGSGRKGPGEDVHSDGHSDGKQGGAVSDEPSDRKPGR